MSSSAWLAESATECTDSASIAAEPVTSAATNLLMAIPRFATSAVTTALVLPSAAISGVLLVSSCTLLGCVGGGQSALRVSGSWREYGRGPGDYTGYGRALGGGLPAAAVIGIAVAVFLARVAVSGWWLRRHHYGPVEWLLRALTRWEQPPWRRGTVPAAAGG